MSEVNWTLEQLGSVVDEVANNYTTRTGTPVIVKRVNRDDSSVYDGGGSLDFNEPIHKRKDSLETGVYIGATLADRAPEAVGTEFDHRIETVVGLTIEGMTAQGDNWGHVDPTGDNGVPFDTLVRQVRRTLAESRGYPDPGTPHTSYTDLRITNDDPQSSQYRDFYRYSLDCVFRGYEELP